MDMTPFIQAKSDQLNADDLIGGPIVVQLLDVRKTGQEQAVSIKISGGHMPWKPCKTTLRIMVAGWGSNAREWVGRWVELYREPSVKWAGKAVGGVRIAAMSHLDRPMALTLAESDKGKRQHSIRVLTPPSAPQGSPTANLDALLSDAGLSREDVDRWRASKGKSPTAELTDEQLAALGGWLAGDPARLGAVREAGEVTNG